MRLFTTLVVGSLVLLGIALAELPPATSSDYYTLFESIPEGAPYASFNVVELLREPVVVKAPEIVVPIEKMGPAWTEGYALFD